MSRVARLTCFTQKTKKKKKMRLPFSVPEHFGGIQLRPGNPHELCHCLKRNIKTKSMSNLFVCFMLRDHRPAFFKFKKKKKLSIFIVSAFIFKTHYLNTVHILLHPKSRHNTVLLSDIYTESLCTKKLWVLTVHFCRC